MTDAKELDRSEDACHTPDPSSGFGRRSGSRMRGPSTAAGPARDHPPRART
jgi:hypothetical protein